MLNGVDRVRFESNAAGGRVADSIADRLKSLGCKTHVTTQFTTANKETKIIVNSPWVKNHCLFRKSHESGSDYGRMMNFLCKYTTGGKNKHDDVPDGMAMLALFAESLRAGEAVIRKRLF